MHRDLQRPFRQPQPRGQFGIGDRRVITPNEAFESLKKRQPSASLIVFAQMGEHRFDERERPPFFVNLVDAQRLNWFCRVTAFRDLAVQWNGTLPAAPLLSSRLLPLVHQKMLERLQKERAKSAAIRIRQSQIFLFQEPREKFLSGILRVMRTLPLPANVNVKRIPIGATQRLEGLLRA